MKPSSAWIAALAVAMSPAAVAQRPAATPPAWPFAPRATPAPRIASVPAGAESLAAERRKLLEGVKLIPRLGAPGPVIAYGPQAFPLVTTAGGKVSEAVAAAGAAGKGRAVIFGHTGYLGDSGEGDLGRLLVNAVRWCGRQEKPRVGLKGAKAAVLLEKEGIRATEFSKLDGKTLGDFDVILLNAQGLTDAGEAAALKAYLEGGGGLIGAVTGWAFGQTSGGKDFAAEHRGNAVLAGAGLAWTDDSLGSGSLEAPAEIPPMMNASAAIAALAAGTAAPEAVEQGARSIQLALASMPAEARPPFQLQLAQAIAPAANAPVPTPEKPIAASSDPAARARASLEARLGRFLAPADVKAHPAAEKFPGRVGAQASAITKTVAIDPADPGWQSTGLYADAGAKIGVKLPAELAGQGYAVRIGCHTDALYRLDQWKRMPEITTSTPLATPETLAANAFGGLIYIVVPDKAKAAAPFQVTISGAVEAPLFVLGKTTDAQWQQMHALAAPWAELACQGVIITVPADVAREIAKPSELMHFWQSVVDAEDELSGVAARRRRPERIVPDVQISAGFMHSGYPIMIHLPQAKEMTFHGPEQWPGWGFYHELGHNHQEPAWTFEGTTEVTCNLFALYVIETVHKQPMLSGHGAIKPEVQEKKRALHFRAGAPFEQWKSDPFLALGTYIQLIEGFGFDALKKVLRSYQGNEFGPLPRNDDEKRDQWMVRYAKVTGKNLGPFFDAWGIPVSASAKAEIAGLPPWTPPAMK